MTASDPVRTHLESARESFVFSGYQVSAECGALQEWRGGQTSYWPGAVPVSDRTYFDIGSVTKPLVTTSLMALAVDRGLCSLDQTLGHWVSEWRSCAVAPLTLGDLLCHASGLKWWLPLFQEPVLNVGVRTWVARRGSDWVGAPPGVKTEYSDLGFILLGEALSEVWKKPFQEAFQSEVVAALGMRGVGYHLPSGASAAATEVRAGAPLHGAVFDENSASLGGVTPHAGIFASSGAFVPWCREWLHALAGKSRWLGVSTALRFTRRAERVPGSTWALGWDTKSPTGSSAGQYFSPMSFGHLGYTGTSVWFDPAKSGYVVFLSNRVHPSRLDERIKKFRPKLHDAIASNW